MLISSWDDQKLLDILGSKGTQRNSFLSICAVENAKFLMNLYNSIVRWSQKILYFFHQHRFWPILYLLRVRWYTVRKCTQGTGLKMTLAWLDTWFTVTPMNNWWLVIKLKYQLKFRCSKLCITVEIIDQMAHCTNYIDIRPSTSKHSSQVFSASLPHHNASLMQ